MVPGNLQGIFPRNFFTVLLNTVSNLATLESGFSKRLPKEWNSQKMKVVVCSRCGIKNSPSSKFCNKRGFPLSIEVALELDDVRKKVDRLKSELVKRPEVLEVFVNALKDFKD